LGKTANFLSPLTAVLGPDHVKGAIEDGLSAVKVKLVNKGLSYAQYGLDQSAGGVIVGGLATATEWFAEAIALPAVVAGVGVQVGAHANCDAAGRQASGQMYFAPGQGYISF
jgi:hypothetical protein